MENLTLVNHDFLLATTILCLHFDSSVTQILRDVEFLVELIRKAS